MDARVKKVREILAAPGDQYLVPFFQRHYSWRRSEWSRLWSDLELLLSRGDTASQHFLGPLVCTPTGHVPGEVTPYLLIDGQQRLTTLTVLLAALRDWAAECSLNELAEEISEEYLIHKRQKKLNRYRLLPRTGDREVLIGIINAEIADIDKRDSLYRARRFFWKKIRQYTEDADELLPALRALFNAVRNRLSLVVITIDGENPYEIFESLNSTGLPLEQSDLIRNYVFMQVPLEQQEDFNEEHWQPLEELFESPPLAQTRFYRHYLMREGKYSLKNSTFVDFKDEHRRRDISPIALATELRELAKYERWLVHPETCEDKTIRMALEDLSAVDVSTAQTLAMSLLAHHSAERIDKDELIECLGHLVSFVLRRSICGETTRQYARWFVEAITKLGDSPRQGLRDYLLSRGWPDDQTFEAALEEFSIYRRERGKARLILESLERDFGHKEQVALDKNLTIEHVMPQTISDNKHGEAWKAMLGDSWESVHSELLHTIGNLTLSGYNPDLSNRPYPEKKKLLLESHLELNKHFHEREIWNGEAVRNRSKSLAVQVAKLWPRPEGVAYTPEVEKEETRNGKVRRRDLYLEYWAKLIDRLESKDSPVSAPKLKGNPRRRLPTSIKSYWLIVKAEPKTRRVAVGFCTTGASRHAKFDALKAALPDLEKELGFPIEWDRPQAYIHRPDSNFLDPEEWSEQIDWLVSSLEKLQELLLPAIEAVKASPALQNDDELDDEQEDDLDDEPDDG